jgi:uncharacterized membrane protein YhaH (DUF805 family)
MTDTSAPLSQPLYGASFGQAINRFFAKYATFTGRASRSEYWWVALFVWLISAALGGLIGGVGTATGEQQADGTVAIGPVGIVLIIVAVIVALALIVPMIAVAVRRLHDANFSGWMYLLHLIPSVGSLIVLVLTLLPSKPEGARFDK